jgi:hypothetical protein
MCHLTIYNIKNMNFDNHKVMSNFLMFDKKLRDHNQPTQISLFKLNLKIMKSRNKTNQNIDNTIDSTNFIHFKTESNNRSENLKLPSIIKAYQDYKSTPQGYSFRVPNSYEYIKAKKKDTKKITNIKPIFKHLPPVRLHIYLER